MKSSEKQILNLLSDGKFHSGEELAKKLGVTRSAIWKIIHGLEKLKIPIFGLPRKGYQIPEGIELLDLKKIEQQLAPQPVPLIEIFDSVDSTHQYLINKIKNKQTKNGQICLGEHQTAGHGRRGREWHSPFASNLYFTMVWEFKKESIDLSGLSLAVAVAVTRTLKHFQIEKNLQLKWPNDILWHYKKLGGVLLELITEFYEKTKVVISLGLNVNMSKYKTHLISQPWVDMKGIVGKRIDRNTLVVKTILELINMLQQFEMHGLQAFLPEWQKKDMTYGKEVIIQNADHVQHGIAHGISDKGELLLKKNDGELIKVISGEVSLRLAEKTCSLDETK